MGAILQFLISVTAAAIICGIVRNFTNDKTLHGALIRFVSGLIMTITVTAPLVQLDLGNFPQLSDQILEDGKRASQKGREMAQVFSNELINENLRTYILDKAASYGSELTVEFEFSEDQQLFPRTIILRGAVSPYAKKMLQNIIERDLGIAKENQLWIG